MEARRDAEKVGRDLVAFKRVNVVFQAAWRGVVGDGVDKFFQLANAFINIIGNRVNLGPNAGGKNYSPTGVRRQPTKMFP